MAEIEKGNPEMAQDLTTRKANLQFVFPFLLQEEKIEGFAEKLLEKGFVFFDLENMEQENRFYGSDSVSHRSMEKYFMPNIEPIVFPATYKKREGLRRFTKKINQKFTLSSTFLTTDFTIDSFDIFICPFHIGLMNIRVTLPKGMDYSAVLAFGDIFRVLEPIAQDEESTKIFCSDDSAPYTNVKKFVFNELLTVLKDYIESESSHETYFGSLPFFVDERMYVIGHVVLEEDSHIREIDLYRAVGMNGYDSEGLPFIGAKNPDYIKRYCQENVYDRWGDETYYIVGDDAFICVTKVRDELEQQLAGQMYGEHFYSLLLFYYYKIVLLELTHENSQINIEKDQSETELLIVMITEFSAKYYFPQINSTSTGQELFELIRKNFKIEDLYRDVKETLSDLYQNQDKLSGKRSSYLLEILTIYSTISGIFGMNLVTDQLKGDIPWSKMSQFSIYEFVALFVTISGVAVSLSLGFVFVRSWLKERHSRRKRIY